uniref:Uncharacterized protein n=1 Tax=Glossina palpalis gambiensis TaxID=67801 RepID=A0A1B0BCN7_9MUSC
MAAKSSNKQFNKITNDANVYRFIYFLQTKILIHAEKPFYFPAGKGGGLLLANFRCSNVLSLAICLIVSNSLINAAKTSLVPLQLAPFKSSKLSLRSKSAKMII